jgi:GH24 family phage-related lysozyme (muramidase)
MTKKQIEIHYTILLFILVLCLIASSIAANTLPSEPLRVFGKLVREPSQLNNNRQVQQYQTSYNTNHYQQASINTNTTTVRHTTPIGTYITSAGDDNKSQCSLNGSVTPTCTSHLDLTSLPSIVTISVVPKKLCQPAATGTPFAKMHASSHVVDFIVGYEGNAGMLPTSRRLTGDIYGLYNDGENNCTVGIGHLVHNGKCTSKDIALHKTTFPNGQTRADAIQRLKEDASSVEKDVNDNIKVHLTQQAFDALVDFTFNEGVNHLKISKLLKDINAGNCDASTITSDLLTFTRAGTLVDRRNDEANLFNDGVYG